MKLLKNEKIIIQVLRFAPAFLILILSLIITSYISTKYAKDLEKNKIEIEQTYISQNKNIVKKNMSTVSNYIDREYTSSLKEMKRELKQKIYNVHSIATLLYNKYKDSKSKEEITELIKDIFRNIRFNENRGYFFIYERNGKNILNAEFTHLEGKNLWNFRDAKGILILQEMNKLLNSKDEIFYDWYWKEANNSDKISKKIGFFKKFKEYDWFIGTGEYLNYFEQEIEKKIINYLKKITYANDQYVFLSSMNGDVILSKDGLINGQNILQENKFINIKDTYKNFIDSNKKSFFAKYKTSFYEKEIEKIAYFKKIEARNWIVGIGFDLNRVNELIWEKQNALEKEYKDYLKELIITSILITIILLIISYFFSKYIEKLFLTYKKRVDERNTKLIKAHKISKIGEWELNLDSMQAIWSEEMKEILGIDENIEETPENLKKIMHKDDFYKFEDSLNNCIISQKEHFCSYRIIRPIDGKMKYIDCRGEITRENTITGTIQDVTTQKILQLENEKQESIIYQQSKMATMGEMIGNIAHQWKQPLSLISMSNGLIKINRENNTFSTKEELDKAFENIDHAVNHLSNTIDDFRNFFKPEKNEKKKFNISNSIDRSLILISSQLQSKNIELIKEVEDIEISSIENYLVQILINIFNNAKDALILKNVKRKLIFISAKKENEKIIIKIYDNAGGISKKIVSRIFEPYFTTKEQAGGTGIGLYMSQDIAIKLLDGLITVDNKEYSYENKEYKGACFTITLSQDQTSEIGVL